MSTVLYVIGFIVVIAGVAWAASLLGVPQTWIIVGVVLLVGLAILAVAGDIARHEGPPRTGGGTVPPV